MIDFLSTGTAKSRRSMVMPGGTTFSPAKPWTMPAQPALPSGYGKTDGMSNTALYGSNLMPQQATDVLSAQNLGVTGSDPFTPGARANKTPGFSPGSITGPSGGTSSGRSSSRHNSGTDAQDYLDIPDWLEADQQGITDIYKNAPALPPVPVAQPNETATQYALDSGTYHQAVSNRDTALMRQSQQFQDAMGKHYTDSFGGPMANRKNVQNGRYVGAYGSAANAALQGGF